MEKSFGHPIFLSLGNISNSQRNKPESKAVIGYFPILKTMDSKTKSSESFRKLQREVFQKCLKVLLKPIVEEPELHFVVRDNIVIFIPRISMILADLQEANKISNVYNSSNSQRPCYSCLISKDDLNNIEESNILFRTSNNMKQAIENDENDYYSIYSETNIFWKIRYKIILLNKNLLRIIILIILIFRNFNIFKSIVPDRMHILDLGLFKYMLDYTKKLLYEQYESQMLQSFEN